MSQSSAVESSDSRTLGWWLDIREEEKRQRKINSENRISMVWSDNTLNVAAEHIVLWRFSRLLVMERSNASPMYLLSHRALLKNLHRQVRNLILYCHLKHSLQLSHSVSAIPWWMLNSISAVRVGTWGEVFTVSVEATISAAVETLLRGRISSVAVEANGSVIDVLTRFVPTFVLRKSHSLLAGTILCTLCWPMWARAKMARSTCSLFSRKCPLSLQGGANNVSVFYIHAILLQQEQRRCSQRHFLFR